MDASTAGSGFDAALKALEALEDDVLREKTVVMPQPSSKPTQAPAISIAFEDVIEPVEPSEIVAVETPVAAKSEADDLDAATASSLAQVAPAAETPPQQREAPHSAQPAPAARTGLLPVAAAGLGVFASVLSAIGLVVATRTVNEASLIVADARERQVQLVQVGKLVHDLEIVRAKQIELLAQQKAAVDATPASKEEVYAAIDALKLQLARRGGDDPVVKEVHDGQTQLSTTLTAIGAKVSRIEAAMGGH
jgi:hypothetical protein